MHDSDLFQILKGALLTVEISLAAIAIGLAGGMLLGILNSAKMRLPILSTCISFYISVIRGTPLFVQILIIYFGLPTISDINLSSFVAGVIALGINSSAYIAEIIRSGINSIPNGQWEAAQILGYSPLQRLYFIILPQAFKNFLPALTNELIALIKESSILLILGVPELTKVSKDIVAREMNPMKIYLIAALFYFVMTASLSWIAKRLERRSHAH